MSKKNESANEKSSAKKSAPIKGFTEKHSRYASMVSIKGTKGGFMFGVGLHCDPSLATATAERYIAAQKLNKEATAQYRDLYKETKLATGKFLLMKTYHPDADPIYEFQSPRGTIIELDQWFQDTQSNRVEYEMYVLDDGTLIPLYLNSTGKMIEYLKAYDKVQPEGKNTNGKNKK